MRTVNLLSASIRRREGVSDSVVETMYATFVLRMYLQLRLRKLVDNIILLQPNLNGWPIYFVNHCFELQTMIYAPLNLIIKEQKLTLLAFN